ncbi:MAG: CHAD domain-containing protein [Chloroflexi bacterium]|nr:CHAD domain-containing protein [Chloroflexota bacterium]
MNAQILLLNSLASCWERYKSELKTCRTEFSEEAVHDFRVAARRLMATLDLLRAMMPGVKIKKIRRTLKDQLDNLDDLRDVQVILADISETIQDQPALKPFQEYLLRKEKKLLRIARREIGALKTADLSSRIKRLERAVAFPSNNLEAGLMAAADSTYRRVIERCAQIDPAQPVTIHRLRIAFKKFRYTVESIRPLLKDFPEDSLKRLRDYQTLMGDIQDMEAALRELAEFETFAPAGYNPETLRRYYLERRAFAIARYLEAKDEVFLFWRAAPNQLYPKESEK